nr:MAG TPA: hypothetical protein [Caudoviricetes sp.]
MITSLSLSLAIVYSNDRLYSFSYPRYNSSIYSSPLQWTYSFSRLNATKLSLAFLIFSSVLKMIL